MKFVPKLVLAFAISTSAFTAHGQVAWFAADSKILQIHPRPYGLEFIISTAAATDLISQGLNCGAGNSAYMSAPIFLASRGDYKTTKDAIFLAYALKKTVRVYIDKTAVSAPHCVGAQPNAYIVDIIEE